jgi:hypothetical protein
VTLHRPYPTLSLSFLLNEGTGPDDSEDHLRILKVSYWEWTSFTPGINQKWQQSQKIFRKTKPIKLREQLEQTSQKPPFLRKPQFKPSLPQSRNSLTFVVEPIASYKVRAWGRRSMKFPWASVILICGMKTMPISNINVKIRGHHAKHLSWRHRSVMRKTGVAFMATTGQ